MVFMNSCNKLTSFTLRFDLFHASKDMHEDSGVTSKWKPKTFWHLRLLIRAYLGILLVGECDNKALPLAINRGIIPWQWLPRFTLAASNQKATVKKSAPITSSPTARIRTLAWRLTDCRHGGTWRHSLAAMGTQNHEP